tara:strand:- start:340 stop:447 length:108 start_codon:yes stop_codon:yes gene_type:complete
MNPIDLSGIRGIVGMLDNTFKGLNDEYKEREVLWL